MKLRNRGFHISRKILIPMEMLTVPSIIILIIFSIILNRFIEMESRIFISNINSIRAAYNLEIALLSLKGYKSYYILNPRKRWIRDFDQNVEKFNYWYNQAFISADTDYERNILSVISLDFSKYLALHRKIIVLADANHEAEAIDLLLNENDKNYRGIMDGCASFIASNERLINEAEARARKLNLIGEIAGYAIISLLALFGVILAFLLTRRVVQPIHDILDSEDILTIRKNDDEDIRQLKTRFNLMISTIKESQKKLLEADKRSSIGQMAAGLSHELNNPIGVICGITEVMIRRGGMNDADREMLRQVNSEAERCKKLVRSMLDFARSPEPVFEKADLKSLIKRNVAMLRNQDIYRDVRFTLKLPKKSCRIEMDSMQISQVVLNLLLNACDAVDFSGQITITVTQKFREVHLSVRDSGHGIKEEDMDAIFIPFFSTKPKGTGLGLAVSRDIIEKHRGTLTVENTSASGTEFLIILPEDHVS